MQIIKRFIALAKGKIAYNMEAKEEFHNKAEKILRSLANNIGYKKGEYDLSHNQGGIAVSGEITLHSDNLYIQLSQTCLGPEFGFMWRTCKGRKDYTGGPNQWAKWEELLNLSTLSKKMVKETKCIS